jgi:hypothetical protein
MAIKLDLVAPDEELARLPCGGRDDFRCPQNPGTQGSCRILSLGQIHRELEPTG